MGSITYAVTITGETIAISHPHSAIGIPVALASGRLLANQLYGVKTYDPAILSLAVLVLGACALVAGLIPARRAASIEPVEALRTE